MVAEKILSRSPVGWPRCRSREARRLRRCHGATELEAEQARQHRDRQGQPGLRQERPEPAVGHRHHRASARVSGSGACVLSARDRPVMKSWSWIRETRMRHLTTGIRSDRRQPPVCAHQERARQVSPCPPGITCGVRPVLTRRLHAWCGEIRMGRSDPDFTRQRIDDHGTKPGRLLQRLPEQVRHQCAEPSAHCETGAPVLAETHAADDVVAQLVPPATQLQFKFSVEYWVDHGPRRPSRLPVRTNHLPAPIAQRGVVRSP